MSTQTHPDATQRALRLSGSYARALSIRAAGCALDLHAQRAVHWRKAKTLIIADPHFGKAAAFRSAGVPVPEATTHANIARLTKLLAETRARRLIVLGDFFHARNGRADSTLSALARWRSAHASLEIVLVRGNHDQHAGDPPTEWRFHCVDEPFIEGRFEFRHIPRTADDCGDSYAFAGHVHPGAVLHDLDGSTLRTPCFHFSPTQAILPAFGQFTGLYPIRPRTGDRVFAIGADSVMEMITKHR